MVLGIVMLGDRMVSTSKKQEARSRARSARLRLDAARAERDKKIEDAAAAFFTAFDERESLMEKVDALDERMNEQIRELLELRESQTRIADLLSIDRRRVREARQGGSGSAPRQEPTSSDSEMGQG